MSVSRVSRCLLATAALLLLNHAQAGTLSGSIVAGRLFNVNLTLQGSTDWAVWGLGSSTSLVPGDRKLGGSAISNLTALTNNSPLRGLGQFGSYGESTFDWSDGTNTASATGVFTGLQHNSNNSTNAINEGFSLTVPAGLNLQEVTVYFDTHLAISTLSASLSDGSAVAFSQMFDSLGNTNYGGILKLDFAADSPGQTLTITGVLSSYGNDTTHNANFAIQGVALGVPVPEPGSYALLAYGGAFLLVRHRKAAWRS